MRNNKKMKLRRKCMQSRFSVFSLSLVVVGTFLLTVLLTRNAASVTNQVSWTYNRRRPVIRKTVYDENLRFVFIAGLEGTGHHAWQEVWKECPIGDGEKRLKFRCAFDIELLNQLYRGFNKNGGVFNPSTESEYQTRRASIIEFFKKYKQQQQSSEISTAVILNTFIQSKEGSGMISYPNYSGRDKAIHHGHLHILAELAEIAAVDLRIVVLDRPAREIARSVLRRIQKIPAMSEIMMITDNAMVLQTQLEMIDSDFFRCIDTIHSTHEQILDVFQFILPPIATRGDSDRNPFHKGVLKSMTSQIKFKKQQAAQNIEIKNEFVGDGILRLLEMAVQGLRSVMCANTNNYS